MSRKIIPAIAIGLIAMFTLSCCGMLNAPKEPVKAHLNAWSKGDVDEAYSYLAPQLQASISREVFADQVARNPIKSFTLSSVSVDGDAGTAVVKGTCTVTGGPKMGLRYELVQKGDTYQIWGYNIHPDLLFEDDE